MIFPILAILAVLMIFNASNAGAQVSPSLLEQYRGETFSSSSGTDLPYRILAPEKIESGKGIHWYFFCMERANEVATTENSWCTPRQTLRAKNDRMNSPPSLFSHNAQLNIDGSNLIGLFLLDSGSLTESHPRQWLRR